MTGQRSPVVVTKSSARHAIRMLPNIRCQDKEDVAVFIVQNLIPRNDWMWKRYEMTKSAFNGWVALARVELAIHWRIDNVYVVQNGMFSFDLEALAMKMAGWTIEPTRDGGYWLRHYGRQVQYYRKAGWAKRRALKEISKEPKE